MSLKLALAAVGIALAAIFGLSFGKERELKKERKRAISAAKTQHNQRRIQAASELAQISRDLEAERRRPLADRVADTYRTAKLRQGAAD